MMQPNLFSRLVCVLFILIFGCASAFSQPVLFDPPLSPRIANYKIDVRVLEDNRTLKAKEILTWHNKSSDIIRELQFHLYLNAFRNSESTFMRESGGISRGNRIAKDGWGYIEVDRIALPDGRDLTKAMTFIQPDDGNIHDKTVFALPLPKPIPPDGHITLEIDFTARLPTPPFARTGAKNEYLFVGQWFPKIGVYENGAWNCHQFHANSEFYADFGVYDVRITVPAENIVGATGVQVEVTDNGDGTRTHYYHAEDVHDFAWTTSPDFVEITGSANGVDIRVLMQKDRAYQGMRHLKAAQTAIEYFEKWYGDYPFPNLTVVDPRRGASGSGGMEYPTLITAGTTYGLPEGIRAVELVIIHEFGHNFWYHLLASNEFEESWMDEGINTYTELQIMNDAYGPHGDAVDFLGIKLNDLQFQRAQYSFSADVDPMVRRAWEYYDGNSYGVNSYSKPGIVLTTLQNYLGRETMQKILRTYVERWRFKHPRTQDFIDVANEVSEQDLSWFFEQAFFSNAVLDYSVDRVYSKKIAQSRGYDFDLSAGGNVEADTISNETASQPAAKDSEQVEAAPTMYESGVYLRRLGDFVFPVELEVVFDNGERIRERWDGKSLWKKFRYVKPAKLVSAEIDPERKVVLDVNYTNNSQALRPLRAGLNKLTARILFLMQFLMEQPEFLNVLSLFRFRF